jgi:hypothetical protein
LLQVSDARVNSAGKPMNERARIGNSAAGQFIWPIGCGAVRKTVASA